MARAFADLVVEHVVLGVRDHALRLAPVDRAFNKRVAEVRILAAHVLEAGARDAGKCEWSVRMVNARLDKESSHSLATILGNTSDAHAGPELHVGWSRNECASKGECRWATDYAVAPPFA